MAVLLLLNTKLKSSRTNELMTVGHRGLYPRIVVHSYVTRLVIMRSVVPIARKKNKSSIGDLFLLLVASSSQGALWELGIQNKSEAAIISRLLILHLFHLLPLVCCCSSHAFIKNTFFFTLPLSKPPHPTPAEKKGQVAQLLRTSAWPFTLFSPSELSSPLL